MICILYEYCNHKKLAAHIHASEHYRQTTFFVALHNNQWKYCLCMVLENLFNNEWWDCAIWKSKKSRITRVPNFFSIHLTALQLHDVNKCDLCKTKSLTNNSELKCNFILRNIGRWYRQCFIVAFTRILKVLELSLLLRLFFFIRYH